MGTIADAFSSGFRDYATDGDASSGAHSPVKSEIRAIGPTIEAVTGALSAGLLSYATKAALDADTAQADNALAYVTDDATAQNNGIYVFTAGSPGSWAKTALQFETKTPAWAGLKSAWVDPFFRQVELDADFAGKPRWAGTVTGEYTLVASSSFNGRALRRSNAASGTDGPLVHLDDFDAAVGDTITMRALVTGDGVTAGIAFRFLDDTGSSIASQVTMRNAAGTANSVTSSSPEMKFAEAVVPAGAASLKVYTYVTAGTGNVDVQALWGGKGASGAVPEWPTFGADPAAEAAARDSLTLLTPVTGRVPVLEAGQSYLLSSNGAVTPTVTAPDIELAVSDVLTDDAYGSPFQGWAERYDPAGISFNAVRLRSIGRKSDVAEANFWRTVRVIVRAASVSDAHVGSSSTVVAVGETLVDPSQPVLNDVVVILRDPDTDEVITLTDSDLGAEYLIGTYFLNADGGAAYGSPHRATQSNALASPQSYYITTGDPLTGNWISFTGNFRLGVDHLLLTDPQDVVVYTPTSGFADDLSVMGSAEAVYNAPALRQYAKRITADEAVTIAILGDSITNTAYRLHEPLRSRFAAAYGISAPGYISANTDLAISSGGARTRSGTWTGTRSSTAAVGPDNAHASTTDTAAFITFGSTGAVAKFFVHYLRQPGGGSFSWSIDGGAATVVSTDGVLAYQVLEINGPGTLRIDIDTAGSAGVLLCGCDVRNATAGQVVLNKLGSGGARASHFAGMASGYLEAAYASLAPDVVMISLGTNDHAGSVGLPSFKADISTIIDRVRANVPLADIALVGPGPNGNAGAFEIDDYIAQMYALARERDVAFVSLKAGLGEYADANARGLYGDPSHPNTAGGLINGRTLWRALFIE